MRRLAHIFLVCSVSLAIVLAGALAGNVLCIGDHGHVAIEAPHPLVDLAHAGSSCCPEDSPSRDDHGLCTDIVSAVEVAVRQTAVGTLESLPMVIAPVLALALPTGLAPVGGSALPGDALDASPPVPAFCGLRCVVLLI